MKHLRVVGTTHPAAEAMISAFGWEGYGALIGCYERCVELGEVPQLTTDILRRWLGWNGKKTGKMLDLLQKNLERIWDEIELNQKRIPDKSQKNSQLIANKSEINHERISDFRAGNPHGSNNNINKLTTYSEGKGEKEAAPSTAEAVVSFPTEMKKSEVAEQFDAFWIVYPRKVAKPDALKAFARALKKTTLDTILEGLARYMQEKPQYQDWRHPATWLNDEGWADDYGPTGVGVGKPDTPAQPAMAGKGAELVMTLDRPMVWDVYERRFVRFLPSSRLEEQLGHEGLAERLARVWHESGETWPEISEYEMEQRLMAMVFV